MNQQLKDNLYVFSMPAILVALYLYNWYLERTVDLDEYNPEEQKKDLEDYFTKLMEDNLWLMVTLSLILNYWIVKVIIFIVSLIF